MKISQKNGMRRRRGFSLVVALLMTALILCIAITSVTFVHVHNAMAESQLRHEQARKNAIAGLRTALGQLQLLCGDDRRVTASADIFSSNGNGSLPRGEATAGKRYWTGVWATGGLDKRKVRDWSVYAPDKKPFLGWLVSNYDFKKEEPAFLDNPVNKKTAASLGSDLLYAVKNGFEDSGERETVTLLGAGTLGTKPDASNLRQPEEREVRVQRVPLTRYSAEKDPISPTQIGSYAYWIGDEGIKADIAVPDGTDEAFLKNKEWFRNFNLVSQRNGVSLIPGLENFDAWWARDAARTKTPAGTLLTKILNAGSLKNYAEVFGDNDEKLTGNLKRLYHDVTFVSRGVFSDVYSGGLKTDLSLAFEMPWFSDGKDWKKGFRDLKQFHGSEEKNDLNLVSLGRFKLPNDEEWWTEQPEDGFGYLYEFATAETTGVGGYPNMEILRGPTWDLIRNYYRLYKREDEKKGFRGLKPKNDTSWIAVGSRPYSYLTGLKNKQQREEDDPPNSLIGAKGNYANIFASHTPVTDHPISARLPEFNGKMRNLNGKAATINDNYAAPLIIPQSMRIAPVVRRVTIRVSMILNKDTAAICFDPIFTIHNPYDVPIEFHGFGMYWTKFFPFRIRLERTDRDEKGKPKPWPGTKSYKLSYAFQTLFGGGDSQSGSEVGQTAFGSRIFAGTTDAKTAPSGTLRLEPGELRNVYPHDASIISEVKYVGGRDRLIRRIVNIGDFRYEEKSAVSVDIHSIDLSQCAEDEPINYRISYSVESTKNEKDWMTFHLFYPESPYGDDLNSPEGMCRIWRKRVNYSDIADENLTQVVAFRRLVEDDVSGYVGNISGSRNPSQSGVTDGVEKQFFACVDVWNQSAAESPLASPLRTNPRPWIVDPCNWDASVKERPTGTGWMKEVRDERTGLCPVSDTSAWGDGLGEDGQTNIVLFSVPKSPLTSLGQLQHAECSVLDMEPGYVVGNSYPHLGNSDLSSVLFWPPVGYMQGSSTGAHINAHSLQPRADTPFAANLNLFDRYFFSGINFGNINRLQSPSIEEFVRRALSDNPEDNPFPNKRVTLLRNSEGRTETALLNDFRDPEKVARNLMLNGAFNINSTSVEAWCAVLSGLRDKLQSVDGKLKKISSSPLFRFFSQIGTNAGGFGRVDDGDGDAGSGWRWFPELSDGEIRTLAEAVVEQVRARGPFMSLGDFVNRRLTTSGDDGKAGALQAAIDASGLNRSRAQKFNDNGQADYDTNRYVNMYPTGVKLNKAGAPGYITQGDILSSVGNTFSARSDTFVIRAYGETADALTGKVTGRAWCEAVVQRMPEFFSPQADTKDSMIDVSAFLENYRSDQPSGLPEKYIYEKRKPDERLSAVNALFGRRFRILSFRWLSPDEV